MSMRATRYGRRLTTAWLSFFSSAKSSSRPTRSAITAAVWALIVVLLSPWRGNWRKLCERELSQRKDYRVGKRLDMKGGMDGFEVATDTLCVRPQDAGFESKLLCGCR